MKKICIVRLSAMGDIIHSMVVLPYIKKYLPDASIDWVCEKSLAPLLEHNTQINTVHTVELKMLKKSRSFAHLKETISALKQLPKYDIVVDMQGLLKSAFVSRIISNKTCGLSFTSAREGMAACLYRKRVVLDYSMNTITKNIALVSNALNIPFDEHFLQKPDPFIVSVKSRLDTYTPYTLLVVGSTWASRNYPLENWIQYIQQHNTSFIVSWGNEEEFAFATALSTQCDNATVAPKTTLSTLIDLVSNSQMVIGNDTGPTHLAWAMGIPSITLFGPTPTSRVYETPINKTLASNSYVNPKKLNKQDFSIQEIAPKSIIKLSKEILHAKN